MCWGVAEKGDGMSETSIEGWREWGGWNKHLEVTQVDSALVCSLYQWGPGPWALGVYLSSWGTTTHYSPPIMPHRAPFLCLNWGAVCAPMNYSIYLLCCSEVCLEKLLQTASCPHVRLLICTKSYMFSLIVLRICWNPPVFTCFCDVHCIVPVLPPSPSSFCMASLWDMWYICYPDRPCLPALIFRQLESLYMSVMPHQNCWEGWVQLVWG